MPIEIISTALLNRVSNEAKASPRLRSHYNFHNNNEETCHRLLVAVEPGTYVAPHCHANKDETMMVLSGVMGLVFFDANGQVTQTHILRPHSDNFGVNISRGTFHSLVALVSGTVFLESKAGPYQPLQRHEQFHFVPKEGEGGAQDYCNTLSDLFL